MKIDYVAAFQMYIGPLPLAATLLVVGNKIREQHRKPTGTTQEMSDKVSRKETNKI
jgi:hypothetical protein